MSGAAELALTVRPPTVTLISPWALLLQGEQYEVILRILCTKNKAKKMVTYGKKKKQKMPGY